ncbi:ribbon-helix-helix domain-containing protein [Deinococcus planocerae]|uniref:ribbon-helix-helix domain-containing protein n=1 Tax=Deinococcus planocerae TaxID=1737569 RepID=UPI000C7E8E0B|nr:hypothetical protein [Deinococcus planocerae]
MPRKNYPLRISPELYAALERWAADELRSVNAQIEYLLTQSVREAGRLKPGQRADPTKDREEA